MEMRLLARWSSSVDKLTRHLQNSVELIKVSISEHVQLAHTFIGVSICNFPSHLHIRGPKSLSCNLPGFLGKQSLTSSCRIFVQRKEEPGRAGLHNFATKALFASPNLPQGVKAQSAGRAGL